MKFAELSYSFRKDCGIEEYEDKIEQIDNDKFYQLNKEANERRLENMKKNCKLL